MDGEIRIASSSLYRDGPANEGLTGTLKVTPYLHMTPLGAVGTPHLLTFFLTPRESAGQE